MADSDDAGQEQQWPKTSQKDDKNLAGYLSDPQSSQVACHCGIATWSKIISTTGAASGSESTPLLNEMLAKSKYAKRPKATFRFRAKLQHMETQ